MHRSYAKASAVAGPGVGPPASASSSTLSTSAPAVPSGGGGSVQSRSGSNRPPSTSTIGGGALSRTKKSENDQVRIVGDHYQLGAEIGRGGFGLVFAALDLRNGRSVAIKQVSLHGIDKDELLSIESEISLLKKLNHENIVKYHDTIRTQSFLYIVLEYMENGSLAQFMKRFGSLSETLVAMYIAQVLRGLAYLHEQGVLHRDVKGANILTTKDGLVKLADFGVAVKLSESQKSNSVVGSPYWMAPEVIEMAGCSFASDIWSVGCTIIELLSTKPPYFDLAPMAALFRIVQDDHPPLPERISPALHDFIMKCFMKEPRLRCSAKELLGHPWIAQIPKNKVEQSSQMVAENVSSLHDRDAMLNTIKLYEKEKHTSLSETSSAVGLGTVKDDDDEDTENWDDELGIDAAPKPLSLGGGATAVPGSHQERGKTKTEAPESALKVFQLSKEDENALFDSDIWDDQDSSDALDFSQRNPSLKSGRFDTSSTSRLTASRSNNTAASSSSWDRSSLVPKEKRLTKLQSFSEKENGDDMDFDEFDEELLLQVLARKNSSTTTDIKSQGKTTGKLILTKFNDDDDDAGFDDMVDSTYSDGMAHRLSKRDIKTATESAEAFPDFEDELGFDSLRDSNQKATARVVELLALLDPSMDDQVILDACMSLVGPLIDQEIFETNQALRRDLMSQPGVVPNIMEALEMKKMDVLHAVLKVINMVVEDNQKFQENLALVGLVPVIIKLTKQDYSSAVSEENLSMDSGSELSFSSYVRLEAAKFVRQSCKTSSLTLQMFIACGGLPVLVDFLTLDINESPITDNDFDLLRIALEGIFSVFNLQTIPKNDICRLFVKAGLLKKFVVVFNEIVKSVCSQDAIEEVSEYIERRDLGSNNSMYERGTSIQRKPKKWTMEELHKTCDIFLLFSQGDTVVKEHMCDGAVLEGLLQALHPRFSPLSQTNINMQDSQGRQAAMIQKVRQSEEFVAAMVKVLKCIRNLSMEPMTLEKLDRAGAIPTLVYLLNEQEASIPQQKKLSLRGGSSKRKEVENIVLQSMFYLCRINRNRQTHAAQAGVIPSLMKVIKNASPLKQFALPILCDLAHASPTARAHLWACDCVSLFLEMLDDKYWQLDAIKSISIWLIHDTVKMENVLLIPRNLMKLIQCFRSAQDTELENLLEPLIEMMSRSVRMNQSLGRSALFVTEILKRLRLVPKAIVRKNLLKMLKSLFESHTSPTQFLVEYNLHPTIYALAQDENNMILVKEIASQLLQAILVAAAVF